MITHMYDEVDIKHARNINALFIIITSTTKKT